MKKNRILLPGLLLLMSSTMSHAQTVYSYVQQNGTYVSADGTAAYDVSSGKATIEFDTDGNAVMTVKGNTVAQLPMANGAELAADFVNGSGAEKPGTLEAKVSSAGYATIYSPFQLQVPEGSDIEVHVPVYDSEAYKVRLNDNTKVDEDEVILPGTGLVLKGVKGYTKTIDFLFTDKAATISTRGDLTGTAVDITKPLEDGKTVYTLGRNTDKTKIGFFYYTGDKIGASKAFLFVKTIPSAQNAKGIIFSTEDDEALGIQESTISDREDDGKTYNTIGQRVNSDTKGIVIRNGKKILVK